MPADGGASLQERDGRAALLFERVLEHPPERVWKALTSHADLRGWHPTPFVLDGEPPAPGRRVRFICTPEAPEIPDGELLEYDPPRLLAYTWAEDELRWELEARGQACVLRLIHVFDDRFKAARDAAGWHMCLDTLRSSLEGTAQPQRGTGPQLPGGWSELNGYYQQRFGIAPECATPPPAR